MIQKENFWSDREKAQTILKEKNILENQLSSFLILNKEHEELTELIKITDENDEKLINEINKNTNELIKKLKKRNLKVFYQVKQILMVVL